MSPLATTPEEFDPCPMGCGRTTDDVAGGPCSACWDEVDKPYIGDEPLGTCAIHGDYWTDDCTRCNR